MAEVDARTPLNLHLQQLAYLREVERGPTWAEAARRLAVSQPALSQAMAELERRLGLVLFERAGRLRRLTDDGRSAAAFAREMLARAEEFGALLEQRRRGSGGTLRVGMIDAGSLYLLPEAMRRFRSEHPEVDLRLTVAASGQLEQALVRFDIDLAFVIDDDEAKPEIVRDRIADEPLYVYAPPGDRTAVGEADWVLYPPGSHTRDRIDEGLASRGIVPRVRLESGNPQVLRQMVALGFGWSVLPAAVAEAPPHPLRRKRGGPVAVRTLSVARRRHAPTDPRVDSFLALARRLR